MNPKELQEKIALYYSKLPANAQVLFSSMSWLETLTKISQKYGLDSKQQETLGTETTLVLLGIIHLVEYEEILTNELGLSPNYAEKMQEEIEETILKTIRPQLVEAYEANTQEKEEEPIMKEIDQVVADSKYKEILYVIGKKYNLTIAQMGILESVVTNLVVGKIKPTELENSLNKDLGLPSVVVKKIVDDVSEEVLKKIRGGLMRSTEAKEEAIEERNTFEQAGVEFVDSSLPSIQTIEKPAVPTPSFEPKKEINLELPEIEAPHPILLQKLSSPVKTEVITTEHSTENITKAGAPKTYPPKADPYRLSPED